MEIWRSTENREFECLIICGEWKTGGGNLVWGRRGVDRQQIIMATAL